MIRNRFVALLMSISLVFLLCVGVLDSVEQDDFSRNEIIQPNGIGDKPW